MEDEYRDRNREASIVTREERWQQKSHQYIMKVLDEGADRVGFF